MRGNQPNNKDVDFIIDTIEDLNYQLIREKLFDLMKELISNGYSLHIFRKGDDEELTNINSLDHFENFKKRIGLAPIELCR